MVGKIKTYIKECREKGFEAETIVQHFENEFILESVLQMPDFYGKILLIYSILEDTVGCLFYRRMNVSVYNLQLCVLPRSVGGFAR
jgi:hypothetical protein